MMDKLLEDDDQSLDDKYLLGFIITNIVGLQYHVGTLRSRALVGLVRQPHNPHDQHAILVVNSLNLPVGYIDRSVSAVLSPLIDSYLIKVEAIVPNAQNTYTVPCQIHVFAHLCHFVAVKEIISDAGLKIITESDASFTLSDSAAVKETRTTRKSTSVDGIFKRVNLNYNAKKHSIHFLEPPRSIIKTELLPHQKDALAWLVHREKTDELPPFWEESDGKFVNILTKYETAIRPDPLRGGIFADEMGLGKTLTLLSLIAFDKKSHIGGHLVDEGTSLEKGIRTRATLVVCPPSVMSTWITELEEHTETGKLKTYMYYGQRTHDPLELKDYDLVLTTYATLAGENNMPETAAKKMHWRRIVLDEAHTIKNFNSQQSAAVVKLDAKYRWAVTGTPIQNGCIDLYSIMVFLQFEPFSLRQQWRELVQRSLNKGADKGFMRLKILMDAIALRRTKDVTLVGLPPKTTKICYVELSWEERQVYDHMKEETKRLLSRSGQDNSLVCQYSAVLSGILKLRQICTHLNLCADASLLVTNIDDVSNNPELLQRLLGQLQDGEDFDCPICLSTPAEIVITCCAHIFCRDCILRSLEDIKPCCPLCRRGLSEADLFSAPMESYKSDSDEVCSSSETVPLFSKGTALIKHLIESRDQHPDAKSVVFSQFRKLLLLLERPLNAAGFKTLRLDGSMNAKNRANVIEQFQSQGREGPTVLLASLRTSSAGINLTSASRVYFMEPWWNHAIEEQAMDRVHRIGQKQPVKVVRFIAQNTIEEKILMLQENKKQLPVDPYGHGTGINGTGINDIAFLLEEDY